MFTLFSFAEKQRVEKFAQGENTADSTDEFRILCEWKRVDRKSVNLDLDSLDFKSSESSFKKDSPDQKS